MVRRGLIAALLGVGALLGCSVARAAASTPLPSPSFYGYTAAKWAAQYGWVNPDSSRGYGAATPLQREGAARVLVYENRVLHGTPASANVYAQAVAAGWIGAGGGPHSTITVGEFDRGIVSVLGLMGTADKYFELRNASGYRPTTPFAFGVDQIVRKLGLRVNAPEGQDNWEQWPTSVLQRQLGAIEAYRLHEMPSWAPSWAEQEADVATELPAWTPLQKQVLSMAIRYAGGPYVWGGTVPNPQYLFGHHTSGGFDCSGFVWWILRDHTYRLANGSGWNATRIITDRTTFGMAEHLPVAKRVPYADLRPGDVLFWDTSGKPSGVHTSWEAIGHTGIYLGNGWAIDSIGSEDGVSIDQMSQSGDWFHDQFAFGWHVLPAGQ